jgi:hypothetical protein
VARWLGIAGADRAVALIVGGHEWARAVGAALRRAGIGVRVWAGDGDELAAARSAGLDAGRGRMMVDSLSREAELEEVTHALLLTGSDDFNALAAAELRTELGHERVQRPAPDPERSTLLPPAHEDGLLPSFEEMSRRFGEGAQIAIVEANGGFRLYFVEAGESRTPATPQGAA